MKKLVRNISLVVLIIIMVTGCSKTNELNTVIEEQQTELESLKSELEHSLEEKDALIIANEEMDGFKEDLQMEKKELQTENVRLKAELESNPVIYEEDMQILEFLSSYNGRIFQSDYQPSSKLAMIKSSEGVRIFPSLSAPFIYNDSITYKSEKISGGRVIIHSYVNSKTSDGWALITTNYNLTGYVLASDLEAVEEDVAQSYEPKEQFRDYKIGTYIDMIKDELDNFEVIKDRMAYSYVIRYNIKEEPGFGYRSIDFWYEANESRVSVINTNSSEYPLESGMKVGDEAEDVFAYYDKKYELSEYFNSETYRRYDIGNGYSLDFSVSKEGKITSIMINGGAYSYV